MQAKSLHRELITAAATAPHSRYPRRSRPHDPDRLKHGFDLGSSGCSTARDDAPD